MAKGRAGTGWTAWQEELRVRLERGEAVAVNMNRDLALVRWAEARGLYVRVDRRTPWGNPFLIGEDGDRETVIRRYAEHLPRRAELVRDIATLRGKALGCHCSPLACHADVLARLANEGGAAS
jgi:hypothetical protein